MGDFLTVTLLAIGTLLITLGIGCIPLLKSDLSGSRGMLKLMTGLAAGFLISSALLVLIPEGFAQLPLHEEHEEHEEEHAGEEEDEGFHICPFTLGGIALLAGFLLMLAFESLGFGHSIHAEHHEAHNHGDSGEDGCLHHPSGCAEEGTGLTPMLVLGLTLHAAADGLAMGAAVSSHSLSLGFAVILGIMLHKMPASFSLSAFSLHFHGERKRVWRDLAFFSLVTPVVRMLGWLILDGMEPMMLALAILFSAGTFLYVSTVDILPAVHEGGQGGREVLTKVIPAAVGFALLLIVLNLSGLVAHTH